MPRLVKIILGVVGLLIALLVVIGVLIKVELTPERVRETVIPLAEEKLQRKVEVGEIRIGLFSGVSLDDLKVMQRDGSEEFVSARALSLSYKLWPLLTGKIVVDEVSAICFHHSQVIRQPKPPTRTRIPKRRWLKLLGPLTYWSKRLLSIMVNCCLSID